MEIKMIRIVSTLLIVSGVSKDWHIEYDIFKRFENKKTSG